MSTVKMADPNTSSRKRKLSSDESIIEVVDDVILESSSESLDVEIVESDGDVVHLDSALPTSQSQCSDVIEIKSSAPLSQSQSQCSDNLEIDVGSVNSQNSVEIINEDHQGDVKQSLLELELQQLRAENEELRLKSFLCRKARSLDELVLTVAFSNADNFRLYKDSLIKLFELSPECCLTVDENNLLIDVVKDTDIDPNEWVVIDQNDVKRIPGRSPKKKKQKAKPNSPDVNDIFVVDTTPSLSTKNNLRYESKFSVLTNSTGEEAKGKQNEQNNGLSTCFNCNESHNLRDCPEPKNYSKINAARQKFKSQQFKSVRYHLEDDQRYAHLQAGKISENLQRALGLRHNQLPEHIYRMRQLGYPPGWFSEIQSVNQSELVLFDFEGKDAFKKKKVHEMDADKIIEYPGFNAPMERGVKDEHRLYGCPAYSKEVSKQSMLEFVRGIQTKAEDNLETCDMDIDNPSSSDKEIELIRPLKRSKFQKEVANCSSPTLGELESRKLKLLAELTQDTSGTSRQLEESQALDDTNITVDDAFTTIDITGTVDEFNSTTDDNASDGEASLQKSVIKTSSFGTPILKSASPFYKLPRPENFSQNVSEVINFENLPNSTGKYEQMIGVLDKVRKTLKGLNEQQS